MPVLSVLLHLELPEFSAGRGAPNRPQRQRMLSTVQFDGRLADSHTTADGSEYVHLVFGEGSLDPSDVIDAEFLLLSGELSSFPALFRCNVIELCDMPDRRACLPGVSHSAG